MELTLTELLLYIIMLFLVGIMMSTCLGPCGLQSATL